ncbi:cob(I)yrinic acid a,c-diamide adenosyltransferase [Woodsholea maritima]|uniref:cob(I)yrinic acid a,c-diamide adenosyltransferase n=1 Tax=Woodsholea maritima TaxID=240237 RepID=UPI00035C8B7F|nr:cob(I)yrinic acid a,c-diamide adenosyltransferase [Woodsholea maritima]
MVRLSRIYTRNGDGGRTRLGDMSETDKDDARVEAYGAVDEANSTIGLAICALPGESPLKEPLLRIQNDMFDVGADLCVPESQEPLEWTPLRVIAKQVERLESDIDRFNANLSPLDSFILPGGSEAATRLHLARTVTRRAERRTITLSRQIDTLNPEVIKYLNRLSDFLFVAARIANNAGQDDVKWVPGASR